MRCALGRTLARLGPDTQEVARLVLDDRDADGEFVVEALESLTGRRFPFADIAQHGVGRCVCASEQQAAA